MKLDLLVRALTKWTWVGRIAAGVVLASAVWADDIALRDGRVFKDAKIISQSPVMVLIRYPGGASSVAKTLLPDNLLAQYPLGEKIVADTKAKEAANAKIKEGAEKGDAAAQYQLGAIYLIILS